MDASTILLIVTGTGEYASGNLPTGLWLSELTHIYHSAEERGYEITVASPKGGNVPIDPESLKPLLLDKISRKYWDDPAFRRMLQHTQSLGCNIGKDVRLHLSCGWAWHNVRLPGQRSLAIHH